MKHSLILLLLIVAPMLPANAQSLRDSKPIGFYSSGSIQNAASISPEGPGYMRLFTDRNRGWGSEELVSTIVDAAAEVEQLYPGRDRLQVGDLSAQTGGQISRHGSHQNGLDVDLTYYRNDGKEQNPESTNGFTELMVKNSKVSPNFDVARNWEIMKVLHKYGDVQRIFVDPIIKRTLCSFSKKIGEAENYSEVLRSLRPYQNHADHFHLRLRCPSEAKDCLAQEEVLPGLGC